MDYSIWKLYKYGLSTSMINTLIKQIDFIFDLIILDKRTKILSNTNRKAVLKKTMKVIEENPSIFDVYLFDNPYILLQFNAPVAGLSRVVEKNKIISINQLRTMSVNEINSKMDSNMKNTIKKIKKSIEKLDSSRLNKKNIIKTIILYNIFKLKKTSIVRLVDIVKLLPEKYYDELNISINEALICLNELVASGYMHLDKKIYFFPSNIYYKSDYDEIAKEKNVIEEKKQLSIPLFDYLKKDFKDKDILLHRLKGKTLEETGDIYNLSRERIRQRQAKLLKKMPKIIEVNKYKEAFETYSFSKNEFVAVFNVQPEIYELLSLVLKKGKKDTANYILKSEKIPGSQKIAYLEKYKYFLTRFGEMKKINKTEFVEEILYKYKDRSFKTKDFLDLYLEEAKKYPYLNLEVNNPYSVEGLTSRSQYIINTFGRSFRYYDLTPTTDDIILKGLINNLGDGCYSMQKIFNENKELMNQFDIRDEYELHNFYRKRNDLLNANIKLGRSPEFVVGDIQKSDFIGEILMEYSEQLLEDCVNYLYEEYGFRKNTMSSYIFANYRTYIDKDRIKYSEDSIEKLERSKLKSLLVNPVYLKNEVIKLFNDAGLKFNTILLSQMDYYMTGNIIYERKYKNVHGAFTSIVMSSDIWRRGHSSIEQSNEMTMYLSQMERKRKLIVLDEGVYAKVSFLEKKGIKLKMIENFVESVYNFLPKKGYFTLYSLYKINFQNPLLDYGFERIFYERLILTSSLFNPVNRISPILFAKEIETPVTLSKFLSNELNNYKKGIDLYDFRDELKDKYNIEFEIYDIQYRLQKIGVYYSKKLEKLYIDKEIYLDEVYGQ